MLVNQLFVCVILSVLQLNVKALEISHEELLQKHVPEVHQQMSAERQHMHQETATDALLLKQQLKEIHRQMATEVAELRQQMEQQLETERQKREHMEKTQHEMQQHQRQMQQKISSQEKENAELKQSIENINHKLANNILENLKLSEIVSAFKQDSTLGSENVSDMVKVGAKHNGSFIGFSAYANETRDYNEGMTVLFHSVLTNVGSLYAPDTSTFTCSYPGYYLFTVSVYALAGDSIVADLIMGSTIIASVYSAPADPDTASNAVLVLCPQATRVFVMCIADDRTMYGHPQSLDSMFTGVLLAQL